MGFSIDKNASQKKRVGRQSSELNVQARQRGFFGFRIISSDPGQLNRAGVQLRLPTALRVRVRLRDHWHLHGTTALARWQHWALEIFVSLLA